jgi:arylsulfatase A-like enzyme
LRRREAPIHTGSQARPSNRGRLPFEITKEIIVKKEPNAEQAFRSIIGTQISMLLLWGIILLSAGVEAQPTPPQGASAARPNVLIVLTDDQGYGDLSCHGNPVLKTPSLDKFHAESVRFTSFHVAPVCTPTRGQLLTGMDALRNGAWSWAYGNEMIHREVATMPQIFRMNGYQTGHFGKWHLGEGYPHRPQDRGFDESVTFGGGATHQTPDYWQNDNVDDFNLDTDGQWRQRKGYRPDGWYDLAIAFMKRSKSKGEPFLCYLADNLAHSPYYVDPSYTSRYSADPKGYKPEFFGMIAKIDENMGRLDRALKDSGLYENTIVLYITDNGGTCGVELFNAGMRGKKGSYYEGGHRGVCFIRWPNGGFAKPRDIDELAQAQDILPTLLDLCGLTCDSSTHFDGMSLAGLLRGTSPSLPDRKLVVQWSREEAPAYGECAVLWRKWRLVNDRELYDLTADPAQTNDLARLQPEIVNQMKAHYAQWWKGVQPLKRERIVIGGAQDPVPLTLFDWRKRSNDLNVTEQSTVWLGYGVNGEWTLEAAEAGAYSFELRRYPKEVDMAICAAYPRAAREFRTFDPCKALPIAQARLKIGDVEQSAPVASADKSVLFRVVLPKGPHELKTWFLEAAGQELCGAYYVTVSRVK